MRPKNGPKFRTGIWPRFFVFCGACLAVPASAPRRQRVVLNAFFRKLASPPPAAACRFTFSPVLPRVPRLALRRKLLALWQSPSSSAALLRPRFCAKPPRVLDERVNTAVSHSTPNSAVTGIFLCFYGWKTALFSVPGLGPNAPGFGKKISSTSQTYTEAPKGGMRISTRDRLPSKVPRSLSAEVPRKAGGGSWARFRGARGDGPGAGPRTAPEN